MIVFLKAIALGIVEGVTEFLPISSTGHLVLVEDWLELGLGEAFAKAFSVAIQLPAILAVVLYFWRMLFPFGKGVSERNATFMLYAKIIVAVLPAIVLGVLFDDLIESYLLYPLPVALALLIGGIVLIWIESRHGRERCTSLAEMGFPMAFYIGFFQCLAMLPGTSRSAATIIGAMLLGASRPVAAEFSFFLAIPTMLGATTVTLYKHGGHFTSLQWAVLAVGSAVSFLVAYASIAFLMRFIQSHDFKPFGYYRIALALIVLAAYLLG